MHSQIFVLAEDINNIDFENMPTEDELFALLDSTVNCVSVETSLEEDIQCFDITYNVKPKPIKFKGNTIYKINKNNLITALKEEKKKRLKEVREILSKNDDEIDPSLVAKKIYNKLGFFFFFIDIDMGILNEMDLLENSNLIKSDTIYIVISFDYHF